MPEPLRAFRFALRSLALAPAVALIAILTLGLGVGAATSIFSVVNAVLLRPLPFPHSQQLLAVRETDRQFPNMSVSFPDYLDWVAGQHSFSSLAAYVGSGATLTHAGPPEVIAGQQATASYFTVLAVKPELGRTFLPSEDRVGAPDVVVISDALWRRHFGAQPSILGQVIELDSKPRTVVGVMPAGFPGIASGIFLPQYWVPLGARATAQSGLMNRGSHPGLTGVGRLNPGVTQQQASADLGRIAHALAQQYPKSNTDEGVHVTTYMQYVVRNSDAPGLWMLLGAVGLLLLVACANVANLLLARAAGRQKTNAIRTALGASRGRLMGEQMVESLCLGLAGGALGLALAAAAMRAIPALLPVGMARTQTIGLDAHVLLFALALALATSVLFGLAPAWRGSQTRLADVLKQGGRDSGAATSGGRLRATLVAIEMGLALVLLAGAGLLIRSLVQLQSVDPGFNPHGVLTTEVDLPAAKYPKPEQATEFFRQARLRLANLPGVTATATANPLPFSGNDWENGYTVVGRPAPPPGQTPSANYEMISGDYFGAMGIHLLRGRAFDDRDTSASTPVIIVDQLMAKRNWPGPDPVDAALGKQLNTGGKDRTIVGVIARVQEYDLDGSAEMDALPEMFVPAVQTGNTADAFLILRTAMANPMDLRASVTGVVQGLDADQPLFDMQTMDQRVAFWLAQRRVTLELMAAFAVLALLLAAIGIYGVLSYSVAQREHEIGLRMALGAGGNRVLGMMLGQGLRLALAGAAGGVIAVLLLGRVARSFVFGVSASDPLTLVAVALVLLAVAVVACWVPAHRATRVDPVIALRGE